VNEAIVLIDPDFLFMRRLDVSDVSALSPGKPTAQSYGLGDQWLSFNLSAICGIGSPCTRVASADVYEHFSAGPPYVVHSKDVLPLATEWSRLVPPTCSSHSHWSHRASL
jgi:hypothetical protein